MKKLFSGLFAVAIMTSGCASVNTAQVDGKTVVTATRAAPVILTALGAPLTKCLADLEAKGVTTVVDADGPNADFLISRLSNLEVCQATGVK